ncbi:hypothetical protein ABB37_00047 [Leptomonas pyrrhocoris]|uniref:Rab-GAP TBC domain-containing protein n=1 Tax=Leptomonas pyrrhocoris TaxID=157538 RepID=A0A0M9G9V0_LEPPY|nr:hypothetical protein ABB37_00047 [Leptomonas pyrrhocoris]KPA85649.1 hypothetical protein ABB37_00047 [Leptomonas pyrrhocoris]|eukprot:XP_015664088.1 hypothetical protein ABB37_00047 [Leptomonas pyrrhocoris]
MPLSADGILGFFDGTTRRCEAFTHVSLAAAAPSASSPTAVTAAPRRFRGTPVLEADGADLTTSNSNNGGNSKNGPAQVIRTATAVPQSQTSSSSWTAEVNGTLYICALPEVTWNSIAAVTATSAPSQRQLAFFSEASAFCPSLNQSVVQGAQGSPQSTAQDVTLSLGKEEVAEDGNESRHADRRCCSNGRDKDRRNVHLATEELPEASAFDNADDATDDTRTPPRPPPMAKRRHSSSHHRDPMSTEDPRNRQGSLDHISPQLFAGGDGGTDERDGIQLPEAMAGTHSKSSSLVFRDDSRVARTTALRSKVQGENPSQLGGVSAYPAVGSPRSPVLSTTAGTPPQSTSSNLRSVGGMNLSGPTSAADDALVAGTVTVLLWIATDAPSVAVGEGDDSLTVSPVRQLALSPRNNDHHHHSGDAARSAAGTDKSTMAATTTTLPACLCFNIRDIATIESCDTDVTTTRERRVQRLTAMLESGAPVYTAKSTSDIFEWAGGATSNVDAANTNRSRSVSPMSGSTYGSGLRPLPLGGHSCSFVFYQGGITRCVASLRKYSPKLIFTCLGVRGNYGNSSNSAIAMAGEGNGAWSGTGGGNASPKGLRRVSSAQMGPTDVYTVEVDGNVFAGLGGGRHPPQALSERGSEGPLPAAGEYWKTSLSPPGGQQQTQQQQKGEKSTAGGWRARFSPTALFRPGKHAVLVSDEAQSPLHAVSSALVGIVKGVGGDREGHDLGKKRCASQSQTLPDGSSTGSRSSVAAGGGANSSSSSFEDLHDEMTAVRLGACYVPPKPSLPPVGLDPSMGLVTAPEWEAVFDAAPLEAPAATTSSPATTTPAAKGVASKRGRVLNADRWRAFRRSLFERGGLADNSVRFEVWCYLLGAYPIGSTQDDQKAILSKEKELYTRLTTQWKSFLAEQEEHFAVYRYAKHSIIKDVERTDRSHPAFSDDKSDMLRVLQELLLAHVMYNMDLGYSQGMSDVAAIASLVAPASEEAAMFLCFRKMLREHMESNFVIEERKKDAPYAAVKGLQRKLYQVQVLIRHFHPRLYGHLKMRCMAEDMTFCFRWLLVCFKRDLGSLADTMRFWDVLFACPYTKSYEVIVTVALLVALAPQIITHIHAYEILLQFMNVLSSGTSVDQIVQCAREFYENVCVIETRELRRQHRRAMASANPATLTSAAVAPSEPASSEHFPTVEEMVLLLLETDGPL